MKTMKRIAIVLGLFSACMTCFAQGIDASVQVTNEFESSVPDMNKMNIAMSVPDTLRRFDYNFDYSGFDKPFKGVYEFSPYSVLVKPESSEYDGRKMFLRAGAGYTLHPELDFVWSPLAGEKFALNVFATSDGYLLSSPRKNHDLSDKVGVDMRWTRSRCILDFSLSHEGVYSAEDEGYSLYNSGLASFRVRSTSDCAHFIYDISVRYRYGADAISFSDWNLQQNHNARIDGSIGPVIRGKYRLLVDFTLMGDVLKGALDTKSAFLSATPHMVFLLGKVSLDAGVKLDYSRMFTLSPSVKASVMLGNKTKAFAGFTAGQIFNTYSDYKAANHHYQIFWHSCLGGSNYSTVSKNPLNIYLGLDGHAGSHFQYCFKGGYAVYADLPLVSSFSYSRYEYVKVRMPYGNVTMGWKSERFDANLNADLRLAKVPDDAMVYGLPCYDVDFKGRYNWSKRFYLGLSFACSGAMKAYGMLEESTPAWYDLGVSLEYRLNTRFSLWAKGGNLLGSEIRRNPLYVEKGRYGTLGICWNL